MTPFALTALGRLVDLEHLPDDLDLVAEVVEPLARTRRYAGQCPLPLSVAEHSVRGARAIIADLAPNVGTPSATIALAAAAFLLHDDHEAFAGDMTTPFARLAIATARELDGPAGFDSGHTVGLAITRAKCRLSARIREIAGLPAMLPSDVVEIVADMDHRIGAEERRRLWGPRAELDAEDVGLHRVAIDAWRGPEPRVWCAARATIEWRVLWNSLRVGRPLEVPFA